MSSKLELLPDPTRMVEGLRDTGYQFNTSIADIIDNSIAANATLVDVRLEMDVMGNALVEIYDNGIGMDKDELINAMKYGSKPRENAASLGKFGLGLKTASTAFCRRLVVISRASKDSDLLTANWDLDHIKDENRWELVIESTGLDDRHAFQSIIGSTSGTIVRWEKVDRLLKRYAEPGGAYARKALTRISNDLKQHLGMVFQRFIDETDTRAENVKILLDGNPVVAWDPFCSSESELVSEDSPEVAVDGGEIASFQMRAYVLPRQEEFSTPEAAKSARINNPNQGMYIYRENRLIHGPDWLRIFIKEPHYSLLRVEFSFDHMLDEGFQIDIKKSQIILNDALYERIIEFLKPPRRAAETVYRKGRKKKATEAGKGAHDSSNRAIGEKQGQMSKPHVESFDEEQGEAELTNKLGRGKFKLMISRSTKPTEVYVQPVDSIDDGMLWEPCLIDGQLGVRINTSHEYYSKIYMPNINEGVTIQGMDSLLWGLGVAEMNCYSETTRDAFEELRYEVSRNLKKLVKDLPDPPEGA